MIAPGVLLDTGPIVALLSKHDTSHDRAVRLLGACQAPFRCCEAVVAEACFLMRKAHRDGPAEVLALGRKGLFEISLTLDAHWVSIEALLSKYADRPISLADACLIRSAELFDEPRILTFDTDFDVYRWNGRRKFEPITMN